MSEHKSLSEFAEQCYAVMDGKLCIVTRGENGWKRAPNNKKTPAANRELAAQKNKELGVTPEQAKQLVRDAVMGKDVAATTKASATVPREIFEVELCSVSQRRFGTSLKFPATPFEMASAFDKARITDGVTPYQIEMIGCELECLSEAIEETANIHELNLLAQRISGMSKWEVDCFEGLVMMEKAQHGDIPIPLERLINLTHSVEHCQIAYDAHDDKALGKFYVDNGMSDIPDTLPEMLYEILDYEAIGRKARTGEGGVFTDKGYVVNSGPIAEVYQSGGAVPQKKPSHTIALEVCKVSFNRSTHQNHRSEILMLPADDDRIESVLGRLEAASVQECTLRAVDCAVPELTVLISKTLCEGEDACYGTANELAKQLKWLDETGKLTTYRAMIQDTPSGLTLEDALGLSRQVPDFFIMREAAYASDYAAAKLSQYNIPFLEVLLKGANLNSYGKMLMERDMAIETEYGILYGCDGLTVEECLNRTTHSEWMEIR